MNPQHKAVITTAGPFALIGAGVLAAIGTPAAWAVLGYATYKVGKAAYIDAKQRATLRAEDDQPDLFI